MKQLFLIIAASIFCLVQIGAKEVNAVIKHNISSPDGALSLEFISKVDQNKAMHLFYNVTYNGIQVVQESELDIVLDNHLSELAMGGTPDNNYHFIADMDFVLKKDTAVNSQWQNNLGERNMVVDHYNQSSFLFEKKEKPGYQLQIDVRVYNQGVAFRYHFPMNPKGLYYNIVQENSEFVLPEGTKAWYHRWAQSPYELQALEKWVDESERPLTCELANGMYLALGEAGMVDYARTKFKLSDKKENTLLTSIYASVDQITPFNTPWRVIMVSESPGELLENNDIFLNLNEPCKLDDVSWIKPGKIMREMTQTNENSKAQFEFSKENGIEYLIYDWKWYGAPFDFASDASKVAVDLDLQKWIEYGNENGIGVWVYMNQHALLTQMREVFPLYKKWGIKGVKFGFVQVGSHRWTQWLHEAIQLAADNQLMVNIHDEFRTTGENRTWPNIITVEGIRGNEEFPDATHNTILPFTRFIGGLADYTICYMDKRLKTTHAHQLALGVVYFSPLQTIYWYDKPEQLQGVKETEYFKVLPTVWDDTKVLNGEIGKYITVARRSGDEWFVGAITNTEERTIKIPCSFLKPGSKYVATIYYDDDKADNLTKVNIDNRKVDSSKTMTFNLKASGGIAIHIQQK